MNITFIYVLAGWIFSLCLHEWAHARVAYEGGDTSVKEKGYLSFNPLKYMHPVLSIVLPIVFLLMGGFGLPGGAVYIDESRLGHPRGLNLKSKSWFHIDEQRFSNATWSTLVSLAGPAANLILAAVIGLIFRIAPPPVNGGGPALAFIGMLQVMAVLFNLIPIPPLDGFGAIRPHLDRGTRAMFDSLGMMGIFVLFMLFNNVDSLNESFFMLVFRISAFLGIDPSLAYQGQEQFMFWRR